MRLAIILMAFTMSAETKPETLPIVSDADKAKVYKLLWQQQSAEAKVAEARLALRAAEDELSKVQQLTRDAIKPLIKEGFEITSDLTYIPSVKPLPKPPEPSVKK